MRVFVETPRVLGSRLRSALSAAVVLAFVLAAPGPGFADQRSAQSVKPAGVTFNLAQVLDWIGEGVFAVGRWDGTISVFRVPGQNEFGPMVLQAMSTPSGRGIDMLAVADDLSFFTSDGQIVWRSGGARAQERRSRSPPVPATIRQSVSPTAVWRSRLTATTTSFRVTRAVMC